MFTFFVKNVILHLNRNERKIMKKNLVKIHRFIITSCEETEGKQLRSNQWYNNSPEDTEGARSV